MYAIFSKTSKTSKNYRFWHYFFYRSFILFVFSFEVPLKVLLAHQLIVLHLLLISHQNKQARNRSEKGRGEKFQGGASQESTALLGRYRHFWGVNCDNIIFSCAACTVCSNSICVFLSFCFTLYFIDRS